MSRRIIKTTTLGLSFLLLAPVGFSQVQTFCTNISGNIACTSYDHGTSSQSYCTSLAGNLSCTTYNEASNRAQVQQNYEAGQVVGTALGNIILAAIDRYKTHKRTRQAKQEQWDQFVQDTLATTELACEADPKHEISILGCRKTIFTFNQFLHIHQKDFVPDGRNVKLLACALDKTASNDEASWTESTYEAAFITIDKKQLDRKIYLGEGMERTSW